MKICQEKFEYRARPNSNEENETQWVSADSVRNTKGMRTRVNAMDQYLPPGSNIEDQHVSDQRPTPFSMGGETDVSMDYNAQSVLMGYSRREMLPTDDMYTNEHCDAFYGEMTVDGVTGFLERNNMLDRE
jgi:hypothetical protein